VDNDYYNINRNRKLQRNFFSNLKLVEALKEILQKYLEENKYFKVWSTNWEGQEPMPSDWWQGKVAYYKYKG